MDFATAHLSIFNNNDAWEDTVISVDKIEYIGGKKITYMSSTNFHKTTQKTDGHFWVEDSNGNVINDITAKGFIDLHKAHNRIPVYLPAKPEDEARYIENCHNKILKPNIDNAGGEKKYFDLLAQRNLGAGDCYMHSTLLAYQTGGKLRFGFLGFMDNTKKIGWIFGHPDLKYKLFDNTDDGILTCDYPTHLYDHPYLVEKETTRKRKIMEEVERKKEKQRLENLKKDVIANKIADELIAECERDNAKKPPTKKQKKHKK